MFSLEWCSFCLSRSLWKWSVSFFNFYSSNVSRWRMSSS